MEYLIIGKYQGQPEVIDRAEDIETARYLMTEYQMAFGPEWSITISKN